jgi:hypothetical protein
MTSNTCSGQEFPDTGIVYSVMSFSLKFERNLILRSPQGLLPADGVEKVVQRHRAAATGASMYGWGMELGR